MKYRKNYYLFLKINFNVLRSRQRILHFFGFYYIKKCSKLPVIFFNFQNKYYFSSNQIIPIKLNIWDNKSKRKLKLRLMSNHFISIYLKIHQSVKICRSIQDLSECFQRKSRNLNSFSRHRNISLVFKNTMNFVEMFRIQSYWHWPTRIKYSEGSRLFAFTLEILNGLLTVKGSRSCFLWAKTKSSI